MNQDVNSKTLPEYARRALIGVLTPQANTTVEPEFALLWPPGVAMLNARLTSPKATINERLLEYLSDTESQLDQFANAPVSAVAFACTGASYLAGREAEDSMIARIKSDRGLPFVTSACAVTDALRVLDAKKIGLVSPYPPDLTETSIGYWESRGFEVAEVVNAFNPGSDFHPIYSLSADSAEDALAPLEHASLDAIVMLGTGMPTLAPIKAAAGWQGPPVISCMLALAWRTLAAAEGRDPDADDLRRWIHAEGWGDRLARHLESERA